MTRIARCSLFLFAATVAASCGDTSNTPPSQLNLDRPVDIAFACYGGLRITNGGAATVDQDIQIAAQPVESCNIRSGARDASNNAPTPAGQESLVAQGGINIPGTSWYGFILQSAPGTVAQYARVAPR